MSFTAVDSETDHLRQCSNEFEKCMHARYFVLCSMMENFDININFGV